MELSGDVQRAVAEYRRSRQKMNEGVEGAEELFNRYFEMLIDLYREELECWIRQNEVIRIETREG